MPRGAQLAGFPDHRTHGCADDTRRGDSGVGLTSKVDLHGHDV